MFNKISQVNQAFDT